MAITDPLVLPPDVVLVPVAELPEETRRSLGSGLGDWAITRPRLRTASRLLDAPAAALLAELRTPCTVVEAVIRYSRERGLDPEATLEEAYPLLDGLLAAGFLVAQAAWEEGAAAPGIEPSLATGDEVGGWRVVAEVHTLEDTEVYQVEGPPGTVALKIARHSQTGEEGKPAPGAAAAAGLLLREGAVLRHLGGAPAPRLLAEGAHAGRPWLALEWCPGGDAATAAAELRRRGARAGLLALCQAIAEAYARLAARGVVHGDVHPWNVLVPAAGEVRLVDFGLCRWDGLPGGFERPWRGGIAFFFEPEYAAAALAGEEPPPPTPEGEQHAVAALLYYLLAGAHYRDFSLAREEMLRQIATEPPLPFAARGAEPWPEVEALLARALAKAPAERYGSVAELAAELARIAAPPPAVVATGAGSRRVSHAAEALLGRFLARVAPGGALFTAGLPAPPRASVHSGAAGIAYALYRIAQSRGDAELLALADLWCLRAEHAEGEEAFSGPGLPPEVVGPVSPYHTATGVHAVRALVAHAAGDLEAQERAVAAFILAGSEPAAEPDLALGRSGVLLAAALLRDTLAGHPGLTALGEELLAGLWRDLDALPPVADLGAGDPGLVHALGMAHGWAGFLYATLQWCRAAGAPHPAPLAERLAELAACARPWGRGLRWRWQDAEGGRRFASMPGWCNGSAGFVHLWTFAHRVFGDDRYRTLAEGAAWNAWEAPDGGAHLCCGLAGRAYALLAMARHGDPEWLERARELAERAAGELVDGETGEPADSLYRGEVGVAVLAADLARPEAATMPFFEEEGWGAG